jgi:hypothetical protein
MKLQINPAYAAPRALPACLLPACLLLAAGCAPSVKVAPIEPPPLAVLETPEAAAGDAYGASAEPDPTEPEPAAPDETAAIDLTDIDGLLRSARGYCNDSSFADADAALRRAAAFLMKNSLEAEG